MVLRDDDRVRVGRETVRRWLREAGLVWRRPRPVIRPNDPDRERKLRALRALLKGLPADETAVFMDEVDVNLNANGGAHACGGTCRPPSPTDWYGSTAGRGRVLAVFASRAARFRFTIAPVAGR
ncbi:MAG: transposase [Gemmataceae bacterium]|nr:transposase [Gemmataceae bacterium]